MVVLQDADYCFGFTFWLDAKSNKNLPAGRQESKL